MPTYTLLIEAKGKDSASGTLKGLNNSFKELTGVSLGAGAVIGGLSAALKYSIDQAAEAEQVMAQTAAVIKSTGGAAGMSAQQIGDMANALSQNSTFADDNIQKGENLLLTFTNIGANVFPQATQAMLDMATAMGTDASGGAIQLGKALNDPTEGISALTRVGVTFTEEQKKQIKAMQEMGDMAGAQKIILAELNKEFGGSAAAAANTYAGKMTVLKNNVDNLAEAFGKELLPILSEATSTLNLLVTWHDKVAAAEAEATKNVNQNAKSYEEWVRQMAAVKGGAREITPQAEAMFTAFADGTQTVTSSGSSVEDFTGELLGMSRAQWDASQSTTALADAELENVRALRNVSTVIQPVIDEEAALKQKQDELKQAMQDLNTIMAGPVKAENDAYYAKQKETGASLAEVKAELDKLTAQQGKAYTVTTEATNSQAEYELALQKAAVAAQALADNTDPEKTLALKVAAEQAAEKADKMAQGLGGVTTGIIDNKTKIDELKAKYAELQKTYDDEAAAHKERTAGIVFDLLSQKVLADGIQDGDIAFLAEIGKAWGRYDEATATAMKAVEDAVNEHGTNAKEVLEDLSNTVLALPNVDRYINYHVSTTGNVPYGAEPPGGIGDSSNAYSGGGGGGTAGTGGGQGMNLMTGSAAGGTVTITGPISINVNGAGSPQKVAEAVVIQLASLTRSAINSGAAMIGAQ